MHRLNCLKLRLAILPVLMVALNLAAPGEAFADPDGFADPAAGPLAAEAPAAGLVPYLSVGAGVVRSEGARFRDGRDSGNATLYGSGETFDAGAVESGLHARLAAGVRMPSGLRVQLEAGRARSLDWRGSTNYRRAGMLQPSDAVLDTWQLLLAGLHEFPAWDLGPRRAVRPFVGAGVGITGFRVSGYVQRFPDPDDPNGYLRKGPGDEIPFTALPGGSGRNLTWMLTVGVAIPVREDVHLDLGYRYADAGEIGTDVGEITIVRYREDGTRRDIPVKVNETSADYRTRSLLATLRFEF